MISSRALSLLALLLLATLGIKAMVLSRVEPVDDVAGWQRRVATSFGARGFAVTPAPFNALDVRRDGCRMMIRLDDPRGTFRSVYPSRYAAVGPVRYIYRGRWRDDPPSIRPLIDFYVQRELAALGIRIERRAAFAVALGDGCLLTPTGWSNVAVYQR